MTVTLDRLLQDAASMVASPDDSYLRSYQTSVSFFGEKSVITEQDFIIGAHLVYGWMLTVLTLSSNDRTGLRAAVALVNRVKCGEALGDDQPLALTKVINGSLVGVSKLLHFINPSSYAIWDSWVFSYPHGKRPHHYQMKKIRRYRKYLETCQNLASDPAFQTSTASSGPRLATT